MDDRSSKAAPSDTKSGEVALSKLSRRFARERGAVGSERNDTGGLTWVLSEHNSRQYSKKSKDNKTAGATGSMRGVLEQMEDGSVVEVKDRRLGESQKTLMAQKALRKFNNQS